MAFIHEIKHSDGFRVQSGERHIDRRLLLLRSMAVFFIQTIKLNSSILVRGQEYLKERSVSKNNFLQLSLRVFEAADLPAVAELTPNRSLFNRSGINTKGIYPHFTIKKINCINSFRSRRISEPKRNENLGLCSKLNQLAMASISGEAAIMINH